MKLRKSQQNLILELMKGHSAKEIAKKFKISLACVRSRINNLYKKFNVNSRNKLAHVLIEQNIITTQHIKPKFRKRFIDYIEYNTPVIHHEKLSQIELDYLRLITQAFSKTEIMKTLKIRNMHECNYIQNSICQKLNAKNVINASYIAGKFKII